MNPSLLKKITEISFDQWFMVMFKNNLVIYGQIP